MIFGPAGGSIGASMNLPAAPPTLDTPLRQLGNTVGFWREDHGVALQDGADSAVRWLQLVHADDRAMLGAAVQDFRTGCSR